MRRLTLSFLLVFFTSLPLIVFPLEVEKVFTISNKIRNANGGAFFRLEQNDPAHEFLVVWSVLGDGRSTKVFGAIYNAAGKRRLIKVIVPTSGFYDIAYNSSDNTYLFVYQENQTFFAQLLNHDLTKLGGRKEIETSASPFTIPEVEYDARNNTFVAAWLGDSLRLQDVVYSQLLDASGNPSGQRQTAAATPSGTNFNSLRLFRDEPKDRFVLLITRHQTGGSQNKLLEYLLGPEGTPIRTNPIVLDSDCAAVAKADFRADGAGLAVWIDDFDLEVRKLAATGSTAGKVKKIKEIDGNNLDGILPPTIAHDSAKNHFLISWTQTAAEVRLAELTRDGKRIGQDLIVSAGEPFDSNMYGPEMLIDSTQRTAFIAFVNATSRILVRGAIVRLD